MLHFLTQMSPLKIHTVAALSWRGVIRFTELCKLDSIHSVNVGQYPCGPGCVIELEEKERCTPMEFGVRRAAKGQTGKQLECHPEGVTVGRHGGRKEGMISLLRVVGSRKALWNRRYRRCTSDDGQSSQGRAHRRRPHGCPSWCF